MDTNGDIYVTGYTDSADFPIANAFQPTFGGGDTNGFVTKIKGDGSAIVYSTFLGGADGQSRLNAITVDAAGNAYVAGQGGPDFPIVSGVHGFGGLSDAVVAKLSPDGSRLLYSTFLGGSGVDVANGIALDPFGRVVITGQTSSSDFPIGSNALQRVLGGASDAFVVRLTESSTTGAVFSSPKVIAIGQGYIGQWSAAQSIQVANVGTGLLSFTGMNASANVKVTTDCATLQPGASCSIAAAFLPSSLGDQSGTIDIYDNAPDSPQTIIVHATGVSGGDLELASLVTGSSFSYYGKTAIPVTATLVNHGPGESDNVAVQVTSSAGSANCDPCYVGTIRAGNSAVLRFNSIPTGYGMAPMTARVMATAGTPDLDYSNDALTVVLANPRYAVAPAQLTFSNQPVPIASAAQRITFTSLDQQPLQMSVAATGDFQTIFACDAGALRCYADISFQPSVPGSRSGKLLVTEAVGGTTQELSLSGTGVLAPHAKLSDSLLMFVAGLNGGPVAARAVTITNDGSAPLFLVGFSVTGNFTETNQCPSSLEPGEVCDVEVTFLASQVGTAVGAVTIGDNAASRAEVVTLTGTAIPLISLVRPDRGALTNTGNVSSSPVSACSLPGPT